MAHIMANISGFGDPIQPKACTQEPSGKASAAVSMFGGRLKAYRFQGAQPRACDPKDRAPVDEGSQSQNCTRLFGQVMVSCSPTDSSSPSGSPVALSTTREPCPFVQSSGNSNSTNSSLATLLSTLRNISTSRGCSMPNAPEEPVCQEDWPEREAQQAMLAAAASDPGAAILCTAIPVTMSSLNSDTPRACSLQPFGKKELPASPELSGGIPVADNIKLSPRDSDTTFASVLVPAPGQESEAAQTAVEAAQTAALRVKALACLNVPEGVLEAAEAKASARAAKRAVRKLRFASTPGLSLLPESPAGDAAVGSAAAAGSCTGPASWEAAAKQNSSAAHADLSPGYGAEHSAVRRVVSECGSGHPREAELLSVNSAAGQETPSASLGTKDDMPQQSKQQQAQHDLQLPQVPQLCPRSAAVSAAGSVAQSKTSKPDAAADMTAAAAAVYSTVAADVVAMMEKPKAAAAATESPRLKHNDISKAATRQRLEGWLDGVVADMQADGLLPNHKVYLWIRRPLRAKPTKMQKLQHALATPWHWIKEQTMPGKLKKRQAAHRSRMAALKPIY